MYEPDEDGTPREVKEGAFFESIVWMLCMALIFWAIVGVIFYVC